MNSWSGTLCIGTRTSFDSDDDSAAVRDGELRPSKVRASAIH